MSVQGREGREVELDGAQKVAVSPKRKRRQAVRETEAHVDEQKVRNTSGEADGRRTVVSWTLRKKERKLSAEAYVRSEEHQGRPTTNTSAPYDDDVRLADERHALLAEEDVVPSQLTAVDQSTSAQGKAAVSPGPLVETFDLLQALRHKVLTRPAEKRRDGPAP